MPKRSHNELTPVKVRSAPPGRHADGGGLYLQVKPSGTRSWVFRVMVGGKRTAIGLGPADGPNAVPLAKAREIARGMAGESLQGRLPASPRQSRKAAAEARSSVVTFAEMAAEHIHAKGKGWRNPKHRQQWENTLKVYAYPIMGTKAVGEIETADVLRAVQPIWQTKPETASRLRGRIEAVLDAAKVLGHRTGENPARWRGHLALLLPAPSKAKAARNREAGRDGRHAALPYGELPAFMQALEAREGMAALALRFTILAAARSGEVRGARWREIDLDAAIWTVPADRMKAGKEHKVPLSAPAVAILKHVEPLGSSWVFPSPRGDKLSDMALTAVLRRMGAAVDVGGARQTVTAHGFRSTFRDWIAECTSFQGEVAEAALAHTIGNAVEAAYRRGDLFDKRRKMMDAWASYCMSGNRAGNITAIRATA